MVEPGDMVCLHTGFADTLLAMNQPPNVERLHQADSGSMAGTPSC